MIHEEKEDGNIRRPFLKPIPSAGKLKESKRKETTQ